MNDSPALRRLLKRHRMVACSLAWAVAAAAGCSSASAAERAIEIPTAGFSSSPKPLVGYVFQPAGAGEHPAVVMMHGCGGAYASDGALNARHRMWGELLAAHGYVALMLDSFTSRGVKQLCTQKFDERTLKERDRMGDANAALAYLRAQPEVARSRIAVLGWSHGGGSVLATVSQATRDEPGFAAAVAFYPGCSARAKTAASFHPSAPLLILIGEADDWTPAAACVALTASAAARGEPMRIVTYPGTFHDFDNPGIKTQKTRKDVPNGVHPGQGVTVAPNAQAREDAKQQVLQFLAENLPG